MNFLEKDLEEIIFTASKEELEKRGLYVGGKFLRQKRIGNYGIADLIEIREPYYHPFIKNICKGEISIYELKQDKIGISAFLQALRYLKGVKRFLTKRNKDHLFNYNIVLIGKSIDLNSSFCYLSDFTESQFELTQFDSPSFVLRNYLYEYKIDGIYFNEVPIYNLINEGF